MKLNEEEKKMQGTFRFSFGPWNIHEGADPFGPEVRKTIPFNEKLAAFPPQPVSQFETFPVRVLR